MVSSLVESKFKVMKLYVYERTGILSNTNKVYEFSRKVLIESDTILPPTKPRLYNHVRVAFLPCCAGRTQAYIRMFVFLS